MRTYDQGRVLGHHGSMMAVHEEAMLRWLARWACGQANGGTKADDGEMELMDKAALPSGRPSPAPDGSGLTAVPTHRLSELPTHRLVKLPNARAD